MVGIFIFVKSTCCKKHQRIINYQIIAISLIIKCQYWCIHLWLDILIDVRAFWGKKQIIVSIKYLLETHSLTNLRKTRLINHFINNFNNRRILFDSSSLKREIITSNDSEHYGEFDEISNHYGYKVTLRQSSFKGIMKNIINYMAFYFKYVSRLEKKVKFSYKYYCYILSSRKLPPSFQISLCAKLSS